MIRYLFSREFLKLLATIMGFGLIVLIVFFYVFLPSYTRQGEQVVVPDVTDKNYNEAIQLLEGTGLSYNLDTLYDFNPNFEPLAVTKQEPPAQSKVKPGRKVYLYINRDTPSKVPFPNVIDKSLFEARAELDKWGIRIGKIQFVEGEFANLVEKAYFKNKVLRAGDMVEKFSSVNLVVSKGTGDNSEYISVENMLVGDAVNALQMQGFAVGQIRYEPGSKAEAGTVFRQDPKYHAGDSLARGRSITLFVAGEQPEEASEAVE